MKGYIKAAKWGYIGTSVAIFAVGLVFLLWPGTSVTVLARIVGALVLLAGIAKVFGYFSNDLYHIAFQFDFSLGILDAALGALILIFPSWFAGYLAVCLALFVIVDGVVTVQNAIEARRFGIGKWWLLLLCGILSVAIGVAALLRPLTTSELMMRLTGIALMLDGVQNIAVAVVTVKRFKGMMD